MRCDTKNSAISQKYRYVFGSTQAACGFDDRIEHRLKIEFRAADRLEHVTCCGLIFKGLRRIARPRLHLFEKASVFNRDDGPGRRRSAVVRSAFR
jgi:hypothetical protein